MAEFVLERPDIYPNTTTVGVYERTIPRSTVPYTGDPSLASTQKYTKRAEATVSSNKAKFSGLVAGTPYVAWAEVATENRFIEFEVEAASAAGEVTSVNGESGAVTLTGGGGLEWSGTEVKHSAEGVETSMIKNLAVTEGKLAAEAVTAGKIKTDAVTTAKIKDEAVTEAKLAAAVTAQLGATTPADGSVTEAKLASEAVSAGKIKAKAVTTAKIEDSAVTAALIGSEAVTEAKIKAKAVTTAKIESANITEALLGSEAVSAAKIKENAVETAKIKNEAVTEAKLAEAVVTKLNETPTLGAESVTTAALKAKAVTTAKIENEAVTEALIGSEAVAAGKIKGEAVEAGKIKSEAVTATKIATDAVTTVKIKDEQVTAAKIAANAVETAKIKAKAVGKEQLSTEVQEMIEPKIVERTFAIAGEVKNEKYPGFFIKLGTGEEKKLVGAEYKLLEGTSVKIKVEKGGAEIAEYAALEAKSSEVKATTNTKALAAKDEINITCSSATGSPKGLQLTLFIECVK